MSDIITKEEPLSSDKLTPVGNTKQVTFNPNPVTIPLSETSTTNTASDSVTSIKGTIPIHDTTDPTKIKNVIVSVPSNGENGQSDHTYAKTSDDSASNDKTTETEMEAEPNVDISSSSDDSTSESEESDAETEKPIVTNKPSTGPPPLTPLVNSTETNKKTTPSNTGPKKRGRPRKYAASATPQPAPSSKKTPTPRRSILKVSRSAPVTPEGKPRKSGDRIRKRGRGCGNCVGCVRDDCGKCPYCLDKPKYGGPGKKKQRCALRTCSQFVSVGKRLHTAKPLPDTPKTAAILSVAQSLVAAVHNASTNGDSIPLATTIQQASSPSPNQVETPIIKIPEENFKAMSSLKNNQQTPVAMMNASNAKPIDSPKPFKTFSSSSSSSTGSPASGKFITRSYNKMDHDGDMKCVVCARWRKLKLAKSEKFCTLRCMKSWIDSNPGQNPEDAEPNDKNMLFMPPTTTIPSDAPRAIKKLLINMALPGSQLPVSPVVAPVSSSTPLTSAIVSSMSNNISTSLLNTATVNSSPPTSGIKRSSQESPNVLPKKFKEAPVSVTSATKTVTTPVVTKPSRVNNNPVKKKGPNDLPVDVSKWGVPDVVKFFQSKPECQIFASLLKEQEIDGPALLLLSHDSLVKCLDIKLGPALKIMTHVEQLKQQQATHT